MEELLVTMLNKNVKSQLCTTDSNHSLQVDGVRTVGNISNVKYCPDEATDFISIIKLGEIGFRISFEDEQGPVVIRRKSDNVIECIESKQNGLYWITEEQLLYFAHVDLSLKAGEVYSSKPSLNFSGENAVRLELGNLVHDAGNCSLNYSTVINN